jgi:flagellar FliL protein
MAKTELAKRAEDDEAQDDADESATAAAKQGFIKKLLGNRKMLLIGGGALLLLMAAGGGGYFFFFSGSSASTGAQASDAPTEPIVAPQVAFFDVPDIVVNIQTADGSAAYLKLSASLELARADEKAGLEALKPRIVDQFQAYLRELRVDDLKGSAGVLRLKEELLRRVNVAAAPFPVKDVLLKEMIVQ